MPTQRGMGWVPDVPDFRDLRFSARASVVPGSRSLRERMSPVRDQGDLGSCVGHAVCAAVEYLRRTDDDLYDTVYSPLFVYYGARRAWGWQEEDTGAYIRDGVKVVQREGVPPEGRWPYRVDRFTHEPMPTAREEATRWQLGSYRRAETLTDVLTALSDGAPVVGGFACYSSMFTEEVDRTGDVPMPGRGDVLLGGHAVCFCGYDGSRQRVLFKNSWGEEWGDGGYGTLPYAYVGSRSLSDDFWVLSQESVESFRGVHPDRGGW